MKLTIIVDRNVVNEEEAVFTWQTYIIELADGTRIETNDWVEVYTAFWGNIPEPEVVFVD